MTMQMPFFLKNDSWYREVWNDDDTVTYVLTEEAPQEAIDSYNEFYGPITMLDENGNDLCKAGMSVVA